MTKWFLLLISVEKLSWVYRRVCASSSWPWPTWLSTNRRSRTRRFNAPKSITAGGIIRERRIGRRITRYFFSDDIPSGAEKHNDDSDDRWSLSTAASRCRGLKDRRSRQRRAKRDLGRTAAPHNILSEIDGTLPSRTKNQKIERLPQDIAAPRLSDLGSRANGSNRGFRPPCDKRNSVMATMTVEM